MTDNLGNKNIVGLHVIGDLQSCDPNLLLGFTTNHIRNEISKLILKHGFNELGSYYHQFDMGLTGVVSLAESHVAIHTWPKEGYVSLDVFVCNYSKDNEENTVLLFDDIKDIFKPGKTKIKKVRRYFE